MLEALQRLVADQNHLLQEQRQQLAAMVERATRPIATTASARPAESAVSAEPKPGPASRSAADALMPGGAPPTKVAAGTVAARPTRGADAMAPWTAPASSQRPLHTTQMLAEHSGFWSRLGRGFVNTFSPAYKD
jgi:hypothetical protein